MTLDKLSQITEVGIKSGITLRNINVEGAYVSGVVTATTLNAENYVGNVTGNINPTTLNVSGVSTFGANIFLGDGDAAYFGDGQDLLIFHNSTDSIIRDNGTGDLFIEGGNVIRMTNPTGIETYATFNQDAAVELYYDGTKKFETTGAGVTAYGSISVGSNFIGNNAVGLGQTDTTGRNAGVGTATGTIIYNSTNGLVEVYTSSGWVSVGDQSRSIKATGGTITFTPTTTVHTFTSSGTFTVISSPSNPITNSISYLIVGAGGGGGGTFAGPGAGGGGGGAGAIQYAQAYPVSLGNYEVVVGGGGGSATATNGTNGTPSWFGIIGLSSTTSDGGGGGGRDRLPSAGLGGGCGGGSGWGQDSGVVTGGTATGDPSPSPGTVDQISPSNGWGNAGGDCGGGSGSGAGGGGGSGAPGTPGPNGNYIGGPGGNGLAFTISGSTVTYAGGGGGGTYSVPAGSAPGTGGTGGGGDGGPKTAPGKGQDGSSNTGGGGGGGTRVSATANQGGSGGSGIVIIAYPS